MTQEQLYDIIRKTFPEIHIRDFRVLGHGECSYACTVNNEIVFKVPIKMHEDLNNKDKEALVLKYLDGKLSVPIPKILYDRTSNNGLRITGETILPGITYTPELHNSYDEDTKAKIIQQIGHFARELHDATDDMSWWNRPATTYKDSLNAFNEYFSPDVQHVLSNKTIAQVRAIANKYAELSVSYPVKPVLVHADLHFGNMMFDTKTKSICGILDWGAVGHAERSRDMHYYYADGAHNFLIGYGKTDDKYLPMRQLFQGTTNMLSNIRDDLTNKKSPDNNIRKLEICINYHNLAR